MFGRRDRVRPEPAAEAPAVDARICPQLADLAAQNRRAALLPGWQHAARARQSGVSFSSMKGRGMEYAESRPYQAGDDVRALDWRLTARSGRPHTKIFREERERPVHLLIDLRAPMAFATRGVFKSVQAARTAALLAWKAVHGGDRVGGILLGEARCEELPPARGSVAVLRLLKRVVATAAGAREDRPSGPGQGLAAATAPLRRLVKPGSLVFVCSDFRDLDDDSRAALAQVARHSDLMLLLCHDAFESALPALRAPLCVSDRGQSLEVMLGDPALAANYAARAGARREALRGFCRDHAITLATLDTTEDPFAVLQRALA
jgi:uncharacterized protein (DUF58 family)